MLNRNLLIAANEPAFAPANVAKRSGGPISNVNSTINLKNLRMAPALERYPKAKCASCMGLL